MAIRDHVKRLWKKQRLSKLRIVSKKKLAEWRADREMMAQYGNRMELDEVQNFLTETGLKTPDDGQEKQEQKEEEEFDPRFVENPYGVGCSKDFEIPVSELSETEKLSSVPTSTVVRNNSVEDEYEHFPCVPKESGSAFDPCSWKGPDSVRIDWAKGKRKGKADVDEPEEVGMIKDWLTHVETSNLAPQDELTRRKLLAIARGRAWTY